MDDETMDETFLKQWRIYAALSQEDLGRRIGVTGTQISRIETGSRDFDGRFLMAFKNAVNAKLDEYDNQGDRLFRIHHFADPLWLKPDPNSWWRLLSALEVIKVEPGTVKKFPTGV